MTGHSSYFIWSSISMISWQVLGLFWNPRRCLSDICTYHFRSFDIVCHCLGSFEMSAIVQYLGVPLQGFCCLRPLQGGYWQPPCCSGNIRVFVNVGDFVMFRHCCESFWNIGQYSKFNYFLPFLGVFENLCNYLGNKCMCCYRDY